MDKKQKKRKKGASSSAKNGQEKRCKIKEIEFYIVELSVDPGGSRKCDFYLVDTLEEVHQVLQMDLVDRWGAYHALWYGERMKLYHCRGKRVLSTHDLHPCITYYVGDFPPIRFRPKEESSDEYVLQDFTDRSRLDHNDPSPIDFKDLDVNEISRYLFYSQKEIYRKNMADGKSGLNEGAACPPAVGVQIRLDGLPQVDNHKLYPQDYPKEINIHLPHHNEEVTLEWGRNESES